MAVYIDNVQIKWRGKKWCHLVAESIDELQSFARMLGLNSNWFQTSASYPHYDVTVETRLCALRLGAIDGNRRDIIRCAKLLKLEYENSVENTIPSQQKLF